MRPATIAQMTVRGTGAVLIVLGLILWTGRADQLVPIHMFFGFLLVLGLWTLAVLAARAGVSIGLVALAIAWGLVAPALGLTQAGLLTSGWHWIIQVIHLLVGLGAIGLAEALGTRIKARQRATAS